METAFNILLYGSAIGFWLIVIVSIYRVRTDVRKDELNSKVHTAEQVSAVIENQSTGEKIQIR